MTETKQRIKAVFDNYERFVETLKKLAAENSLDIEIFSPMPVPEAERLFPQKPSRVRWFTFFGGILGVIIGFAFPVYTALQWPIITGGKPVVTIQVFVIIAFELLILFGAIFTLLGLLISARLPRQNLRNYDVRFSDNSFGVIILTDESHAAELQHLMQEADELIVDQVEVEKSIDR